MKFLSTLVSIFLLFASITPAFAQETSLYNKAREYFEEQGILFKGDQRIDELKITKAEFFKIIFENAGYSPSSKIHMVPTPFKDVESKSWYAPYIQRAYRLGIIEKKENFYPEDQIRLIDAFKLILEIEGHTIPLVYERKIEYKDLINEEQKRIVAKILDLNVYTPKSEKIFGANKFLTRKETIEVLYKFHLMSEGDKAIFSIPKDQVKINIQRSNLKNIEYLESVKNEVFSNYYKVEELNEEELMNSAIQGYVKGVGDKYTLFFPPQESKDFGDVLDGEFEGIGAYLEETDNGIVIQTPIKNSPAEKAGVKSGDIIRKVDGKDILDMPIRKVIPLIKGLKGTTVEIEFERNGKLVVIKIVRDSIKISSVEFEVKNNVLIITLSQFGPQTLQDFSDIIGANYDSNIKGIIIDLRSNPGGLLDTVEELLYYWVPSGEAVLELKYRDHSTVEKSGNNQKLTNTKTAIIQNEASASASEILAGTLQDYGKAKIFGTKSFGKGTAQTIIQYKNGASLKVTVAEWLTGKGNPVNGIGINPDIKIEDDEKTENDEAIEKAMSWILGR